MDFKVSRKYILSLELEMKDGFALRVLFGINLKLYFGFLSIYRLVFRSCIIIVFNIVFIFYLLKKFN